jgi:hypothetical protein
VDPVPDPLSYSEKSGSAGNWTRDLWVSSQELLTTRPQRRSTSHTQEPQNGHLFAISWFKFLPCDKNRWAENWNTFSFSIYITVPFSVLKTRPFWQRRSSLFTFPLAVKPHCLWGTLPHWPQYGYLHYSIPFPLSAPLHNPIKIPEAIIIKPEDRDNIFLLNVDIHVQDYTVLQPRILHSDQPPQRKPLNSPQVHATLPFRGYVKVQYTKGVWKPLKCCQPEQHILAGSVGSFVFPSLDSSSVGEVGVHISPPNRTYM